MRKFFFLFMGLWLAVCSVMFTLSIAQVHAQVQAQKAQPAQSEMVGIDRPRLILKDDYVIVEDENATEAALGAYNVPLDEDVQLFAAKCCEETGVPLGVIYAMAYVESRFNADAMNDAGDMGLLQINGRYAAAYGATDLLDPCQNLEVGTAILSGYLEEYPDDLEKALMAYNCGPSRAKELWAEGVTSTRYTEAVRNALAALTEKGEIGT